jgi:hypothetical protein
MYSVLSVIESLCGLSRRVAILLGDVPDSRFARFRLRIGFARQAPFVNYRRAMVDLSPPGSIFSKMLSIQQAA